MKVHAGVDVERGHVHIIADIAANVYESLETENFFRGEEIQN